jgi:hypothetical protein
VDGRRVALLRPLARVPLPDPAGQAAAVALSVLRLVDELVPVAIGGGEDLLVAEVHGDASRMEGVLEQLERPAQVALPARDVAHEQDVELAALRRAEHGRHLGRAVHRPPGVGGAPGESGVDEAEPRDRPVLELGLGLGTVAVELAGRALADPAGGAGTGEVLDRCGQALHAGSPGATWRW